MTPATVLVDLTNIDQMLNVIGDQIRMSGLIGIDCETEDSQRHAGLVKFSGYDDEGYRSKGKKLAIDLRRSRLCGASLFSQETGVAYYFNLGHSDVENRLPKSVFIDLISEGKQFLAHNAAFEKTIFQNTLNFDLNTICTMQMAVSAFGPHEYPHQAWIAAGQGGIGKLIPPIMRAIADGGIIDRDARTLSPELDDLVGKITAKESDADHSWNGFVKSIAYGYGLKGLVKKIFGHEMTTYEEALAGEAHMGQLTGAQVTAYGAEDAFWVVPLFQYLLKYMVDTGGEKLVKTFLEQENPMTGVFSDISRTGMKVNFKAINKQRDIERAEMAKVLRELKGLVTQLLPFNEEPHPGLLKHDTSVKWYTKNFQKYRDQVSFWATSPDEEDDFRQCHQVRGPVSNAWALDMGLPESKGINLAHYMPVRVLIYDLINTKVILSEGKVQSDGEARGKVKDRLERQGAGVAAEIIGCLAKISGIEQRVKLYLTPYLLLTDPDTGKLYPNVTSTLATRRMGASIPNVMQLAKRGESTYVRGFFEPSYDDHVMISEDWSAIELVEIAEFSGDESMCSAFAQLPHDDMHSGAAADILTVEVPDLTEQAFKDLKKGKGWDEWRKDWSIDKGFDRIKTNLKGDTFKTSSEAYKFWRTEVGKGANFNFWYSGWLTTIGERMGWSQDKTKLATERYKARFPVAEAWRVGVIREVQQNGFVTLPDGHRYVRYESTAQWAEEWINKFGSQGDLGWVMRMIGQRIARRGGNQTVNALIQGSCATIAKRSALRVNAMMAEQKWDHRMAHFLMPVHDELVWSVHREIAPLFIEKARNIMIDHPDMFKVCKLDVSPSVGLTFEPWNDKKAPFGQVELFEMPPEFVGQERSFQRSTPEEVASIINQLFEHRDNALKRAA